MHAFSLRKSALAVVAAGALAGFALLPATSAQAASGQGAGISAGAASTAGQPNAAAKAQWQSAISRVPEQGDGCYQASYPSLQWHAVACVAAPTIPLVPALLPGRAGSAGNAGHVGHPAPETVGDGTDYSAVVSGLISKATGTFTNVSSNISEKGSVGGSGSSVSNSFSLQLNSQFFSGSAACAHSSNPTNCQAWQQFVYTYNGGNTGDVYMQYWLINYEATCPSGWSSYSGDCYTNSSASQVSEITAAQLATVSLSASATSGGNDAVSVSVGSGQATTVTGKDTKVGLAAAWNTTEWGVYGDGGGSAATFGTNNSLDAKTVLTSTSSSAPGCVKEGFTGETNNLKLTATPALGSASSPTIASAQTDGTAGTASCSAVAG